MPIVVSGKDVEKLLAIPKLPGSGTGLLMGNAVVEALQQWPGVPEWLAGLCFDTTSANTGIHAGAITVIQKAFDKRLLFLACRHHILEIVASAVFDLFFASSGPNIPIFVRFKEQWPFLNQADHSSIDKNTEGFALSDNEKMWLSQNCECIAQFLADQLATNNQETIMPNCCVWHLLPWAREILFLEESVSLHLVHITVPGGWPRDCIA